MKKKKIAEESWDMHKVTLRKSCFPRMATAVPSLQTPHCLHLTYITLLSYKYLCCIGIRLALFTVDKLSVLIQITKIQFLKMFCYCFIYPLLLISEQLVITWSYSDFPEEELKN